MSIGRTAVVTGASSGIGRGIALALARQGWAVALTHLGDHEGAEQTRSGVIEAGGEALVVECDAGLKSDVIRFHDEVARWRGAPDLLVNNAGIQTWSPLLDLEEADWDRVLRTNLTGCFLNTQAFAKHLRAAGKGGAIVNLGSGCIKTVFANLAGYGASKAGIAQFTQTAGVELGPYGIRVNCVAPGAVLIERTSREIADYAGTWSRVTPLRRIGTPEDVAGAVLFFASEQASFITGQTLYVDGGLFSQPPGSGLGGERAPGEESDA